MLHLSDDNEIFMGYTTMIELYNALKIITLLFFIQKILTLNLGVAFLKSVSIVCPKIGIQLNKFCPKKFCIGIFNSKKHGMEVIFPAKF